MIISSMSCVTSCGRKKFLELEIIRFGSKEENSLSSLVLILILSERTIFLHFPQVK